MTLTMVENKSKRRDKLVIMAEIIGIAKKGSSKTHIMFKANLSFSQLNQYFAILTETNLLEKLAWEGKEIYKPTSKGLEFMEKQAQIINLFNFNTYRKSVKTSFEFDIFPRIRVA